jgi:hypothetical protein
MIDHVAIGVADVARAKRFYHAAPPRWPPADMTTTIAPRSPADPDGYRIEAYHDGPQRFS